MRMNFETGEKEESKGFIAAVEDWGLSLGKGWSKDF